MSPVPLKAEIGETIYEDDRRDLNWPAPKTWGLSIGDVVRIKAKWNQVAWLPTPQYLFRVSFLALASALR
jgi:hypothetical protein